MPPSLETEKHVMQWCYAKCTHGTTVFIDLSDAGIQTWGRLLNIARDIKSGYLYDWDCRGPRVNRCAGLKVCILARRMPHNKALLDDQFTIMQMGGAQLITQVGWAQPDA